MTGGLPLLSQPLHYTAHCDIIYGTNKTTTTKEQKEMAQKNLAEETKKEITNSGHKVSDVVHVFDRDTGLGGSLETFLKNADKFYCIGYGEVSQSLIVKFNDGSWLERFVNEDYKLEGWLPCSVPTIKTEGEFEIFTDRWRESLGQ